MRRGAAAARSALRARIQLLEADRFDDLLQLLPEFRPGPRGGDALDNEEHPVHIDDPDADPAPPPRLSPQGIAVDGGPGAEESRLAAVVVPDGEYHVLRGAAPQGDVRRSLEGDGISGRTRHSGREVGPGRPHFRTEFAKAPDGGAALGGARPQGGGLAAPGGR